MSFLRRFDCNGGPFSVVIDDDDRVAYAYLLESEKIVGDVWLYNVEPAPQKAEWGDRSLSPFLNPQQFATEDAPRIVEVTKVDVKWVWDGEKLLRAEIHQDDQRLAVMNSGARPGWCRNARKDGPLAKVLTPLGTS